MDTLTMVASINSIIVAVIMVATITHFLKPDSKDLRYYVINTRIC